MPHTFEQANQNVSRLSINVLECIQGIWYFAESSKKE